MVCSSWPCRFARVVECVSRAPPRASLHVTAEAEDESRELKSQSRGAGEDMGRKLYVGNLPYSVSEDELRDLFGRAGAVDTVSVVRDTATGRARGFAFVEMATDADAQKAMTELNETQLGGRTLAVNE